MLVVNRQSYLRSRDHITPMLARLHWLPFTARIQFKIALLTFKTLTIHQPSYIHDLLQPHCSSQQLRSTSRNLPEIPRMRTGFAQHSFTYNAPHIWNSLPHIITGNLDVTANTFKNKLKTFYYTNCYPGDPRACDSSSLWPTHGALIKCCIIIIIIGA